MLTRKGSRLITVDGVVYRWRARGRPTYAQALGFIFTAAFASHRSPLCWEARDD
ncbi:hypothetical protein [Micromonospora gifhornensis]|uniref:hypothetical protein n=1 Tax=Micromonospora gifhornensis TaxID=84594 RepID=UPI003D7359A7